MLYCRTGHGGFAAVSKVGLLLSNTDNGYFTVSLTKKENYHQLNIFMNYEILFCGPAASAIEHTIKA